MSLEERILANYVMFVFKIVHGLVDIQFVHWFSINTNNTRGHLLKLTVNRSRLDINKHFFRNGVFKMWNNLPERVVSLNSLKKLKDSINSLRHNDPTPYAPELFLILSTYSE